jgi:hypothetical protein
MLVVAHARERVLPSRAEGKRIYGDLPYLEERVWLVEESDFVCLRIATLAARDAAKEAQ